MKSTTTVSATSPSQNSPTHLEVKPRSLSQEKIIHKFKSPTSTDVQAPKSPTRAVIRRFVKSLSKNALKLASNFSPRRRAAASLSFQSSPPQSFCEARERMVEEVCEVFRYLDADGDGKITWVDLQSALNSVGEEVGENELREMIKQLGSEVDGCMDVDGFVRLHCEERGEEDAEKELAAAFRMFQGTNSTGITPAGLQRMMCRLGVEKSVTLDHCAFIISQVDLDGDGVVSFSEFKHMMTCVVH
ncbi:calmodulin-like protein 2 [Cryptomeria japonica]|uniref:calmodulin-like protein 2 n=1 Tax=Cryptomeria japonica TaxID=3369 RepID=UPI0027DA15E4|nr:calmodulin-like protein 2 [Cryptomeria japonica]